jgi:hypothetical protein
MRFYIKPQPFSCGLTLHARTLTRYPRTRGTVASVVTSQGACLWIKTYPQKGGSGSKVRGDASE